MSSQQKFTAQTGTNHNVQVIQQQQQPALNPDEKLKQEGVVPIDDLVPCMGFCCNVCSCYTKYPDCCGCYLSEVCLCVQLEGFACKPAVKEGECCIL